MTRALLRGQRFRAAAGPSRAAPVHDATFRSPNQNRVVVNDIVFWMFGPHLHPADHLAETGARVAVEARTSVLNNAVALI
jgi:hypothetical protein